MEWQRQYGEGLAQRDAAVAREAETADLFEWLMLLVVDLHAELERVRGQDIHKEAAAARAQAEQLAEEKRELLAGLVRELEAGVALSATVAQLEKELAGAQRRLALQERQLRDKIDEVAQKNRSIEMANDKVLLLEMENNVVGERLAQVEQEHAQLITRWMAKVEMDADRINEANEYMDRWGGK